MNDIDVGELVQLATAEGQRVRGAWSESSNGQTAAPLDNPYLLSTTDWQALIRDGIPEIDYLDAPYFPRGARIWIWGPTGVAKSMYALWEGTRLAGKGLRVSYFSEENPLAEDLRRLSLLRPDPEFMRFFHRTGLDLTDPAWVEAMLAVTNGDDAVFMDSWTDLWRGDESDNAAVRDFDAHVLKPLQAQGTTPITVHHTGHPQMFASRKGASAGRGASSLGQKADVTLEFRDAGEGAFTIVYGKPRIGGERQPDRTFKVVDIEDRLDVIETEGNHARGIRELADKMAKAVLTAPRGYLTTSELRVAAGGSSGGQREALALLADDERVRSDVRKVETADGRLRDAKVWKPLDGGLL